MFIRECVGPITLAITGSKSVVNGRCPFGRKADDAVDARVVVLFLGRLDPSRGLEIHQLDLEDRDLV